MNVEIKMDWIKGIGVAKRQSYILSLNSTSIERNDVRRKMGKKFLACYTLVSRTCLNA